jgi:hypothetical protein
LWFKQIHHSNIPSLAPKDLSRNQFLGLLYEEFIWKVPLPFVMSDGKHFDANPKLRIKNDERT